ncbi:Histidinol-phosphate aminotransferase 2 [Candidatus Methylobacter favarea]|uniref:Histidinol-phosphate aminotransferase n=1 Tax=Candidatus Methylobacter favarea TaxID=2707345 RepID=A0A8S0WR80_9GAMM|nr:histidinol-phosphate transaminase [Candidatus Methylobacter favarea]CAA9891879.1 Histidinol-phosphate aminotransferase 2 [Candidatus Methylobacter favarea]
MIKNDLISSVFRKEVLAMSAYTVADAKGLIKLDAMENPYGWPEDIKIKWLETLKDCQLNRYPDPEAVQLTETIKRLNQLSDQFDVLLGNGSDEIIQLLLMAMPPDAVVVAPDPGFVMYRQLSHCLGLSYYGVPLLADTFELDLPAMLTAIEKHQPSIIFLAYPNNPTGNLFSETSIRKILETSNGLVIIDEAYAPFAGVSFMAALNQYDNLLVMRTVSKLGLAGLRLGYIAGSRAIIEQLNKIRLPYNINSLTQISANFALSNKTLFDQQIQTICTERALIFKQLNEIEGFKAYPSAANFILFRTPENQANNIFSALQQQGILIKNLSAQGGLLADCLRVTIGKPEENAAFLAALQKL